MCGSSRVYVNKPRITQTRARCNGFQQKEFLRQDRKDSVGDHEDVNKIDFLPVPCVVVANKWDAWKNADMEPLKAVAQVCRVRVCVCVCSDITRAIRLYVIIHMRAPFMLYI
jgi:hypothetical protein